MSITFLITGFLVLDLFRALEYFEGLYLENGIRLTQYSGKYSRLTSLVVKKKELWCREGCIQDRPVSPLHTILRVAGAQPQNVPDMAVTSTEKIDDSCYYK